MGQEGDKDRLIMVLRKSTWTKKKPKQTRHGFKRAKFGQEGTKDKLNMV